MPGEVLNNEKLCSIFVCGNQGGMRRSTKTNTLVLVSDYIKDKSIYEDKWVGDTLEYAGMGQEGDQKLISQNKTLNESRENNIDIHLFEVYEKNEYRYTGKVYLAGPFEVRQQKDKNNVDRKVFIFKLKKLTKDNVIDINIIKNNFEKKLISIKKLSNEELRNKATKANLKCGKRNVSIVQYTRDPAVSEHAKRIAKGICQLCEKPAPFKSLSGDPYLETHHIVWLSNNGDDSIENTVALCPNCHRQMHSLKNSKDIDKLKKVNLCLV